MVTLLRWLVLVAVAAVMFAAAAKADVGNFGPGGSTTPGLCSYPAVCDAGSAGGVVGAYWYSEDWPVELNGTHRHCYYHGVMTQGNVGFSMMLELGAAGPLGVLVGGCHYVCPDGQLGEWPNPVGGWKDALIPSRCKPVGPNPDMSVDVSPPIAVQGPLPVPFVPLPQPAEPPPTAQGIPNGPPPADLLPSQTNPVCPNPDAPTSVRCR